MMITSEQLRAMLHNILERSPNISVYVKFLDGRLGHFIDWKNAATRNS